MALFQAGEQVSPFLTTNDLLAPRELAMRQGLAADAHQNSLLNQQQTQQQIGAADIEQVARASQSLLGLGDEAKMATAYPDVVRSLQAQGFAKNAPAQFPGRAVLERLAAQGTPSATLGLRAANLSGNAAILGSSGAPAPTASGSPVGGVGKGFYDSMYATLKSEAEKMGVPNPEVIARLGAAQATVESAGGTSDLAKRANNYFGIKPGTPGGVGETGTSGDYVSFASPEDSARGYLQFISKNPRYAKAGVLDAPTFDAAAKGIAATGYAEDPRYLQAITGINGQYGMASAPGVQVAGPGAPTDTGTAPALAEPAPYVPGTFTPSQSSRLRTLAAQGTTTPADVANMMEKFDDDNRQAAAQAATRQEKAAAAARAEAEAKQKADKAALPRQGNELSAQHENDLIQLAPKIADGTATEAEKRQYSLSYAGYQISGQPVAIADPTDPTGRRQVLARLPREVPAGVPAPPYPVGGDTGARKPIEMTQDQATAATYSDRMAKSDAIMGGLDSSAITWGEKLAEKAGNYVGYNINSPGYQRVRQAQEDFINAVLRKESGAAISASEYERYAKQYFPQPGEDAATIRQKQENRKTTIAGMQREAGPGYKAPEMPAQTGPIVVKSADDYAKVPPGAEYTDPDGKVRRKAK